MRIKGRCRQLGLIGTAPSLIFLFLIAAAAQRPGTSREPFAVELPGLSDVSYTRPTVYVPGDPQALRIRVRAPFANSIEYGAIIVTFNGQGINRSCTKSSDTGGKIADCRGYRPDRLGGFMAVPGKNVLEVKATDRTGREYYASFVLIVNDSIVEPTLVSRNPAQRFSGKKFALIMGVSQYHFKDAGLNDLEFADDDARSISDFLQTNEGGHFLRSNIVLLLNNDATLGALRSGLKDLAARAGPDDLIFLFIAGHGAPDPYSTQDLYFLFADTKVVDMPKTAYPMSELKLYLDTEVAAERVFVVIDTCHSAGVNQQTRSLVTTRDLVQVGDENNISNFFASKQLFRERGRSVLTSSDVNEVSRESKKWNDHGVFTWALLNGLRGSADSNGDGLITTGEIFLYTRSAVQAETAGQQNPIALPGSSTDLTLATVPKKGN